MKGTNKLQEKKEYGRQCVPILRARQREKLVHSGMSGGRKLKNGGVSPRRPCRDLQKPEERRGGLSNAPKARTHWRWRKEGLAQILLVLF